jgi:hypothetical protein
MAGHGATACHAAGEIVAGKTMLVKDSGMRELQVSALFTAPDNIQTPPARSAIQTTSRS